MSLDRIVHLPDKMGGKATIRGHDVSVSSVVDQMGHGASVEQVLQAFPSLEREDVLQALQYAARLAEDELPDDEALEWLADSVEAARAEVAEGRGMALDEHRSRNAQRLARLDRA